MAQRSRAAQEPNGYTGVIVGLWPPEEVAAALTVDGGVPAEDMHLTLVHCGHADDLGVMERARLLTVVQDIAREFPPLAGRVSGLGRFSAEAGSGGKDCLYAAVDVPGVEDLRSRLAMALESWGIRPGGEHGFTPHVTLAYLDPAVEAPRERIEPMDVRFNGLTVAIGAERYTLELSGREYTIRERSYGELVDLCARGGGWPGRLFNELGSFAEPPDWVPVLPKPGSYTHPRWGEIKVTRDRNARFVENFGAGVYQSQLPVDAEHETKVSGALAWLKELRQNSDGSVDGRVEWTDRGRQMVEGDRFKFVSPEWYPEWTDPATNATYQDVLIGLALTTRPFFKEGSLRSLVPLVASELTPVETKETPVPEPTTQPVGMTEEQAQRFAEMERQIGELQAAKTAAETVAASAQEAAKQAAEQVAAMKKDQRRQRFTDEVMGKSEANPNRWFGEVAKNVSILETLADTVGEDSEAFTSFVAQQRQTAELVKKSALFAEVGREGTAAPTTATGRLEAKARQLMSEDPKLSFAVAMGKAAELEPQLYAEYAAETRQTTKE